VQRSKFGDANSELRISGTASGGEAEDAAGSNPVTRTKTPQKLSLLRSFSVRA